MQIQFPLLIPFLLFGCLFGSLLIAAVTDLKSRRIPNIVTYSTIVSAILIYSLVAGWTGLAFSLKGTVCGLGLLLFPYLLGGMGAGDVKLMGAVGAVLGVDHTVYAFLVVALLGGVVSVAVLIARGESLQVAKRLWNAFCCTFGGVGVAALQTDRQSLKQKGLPYGVVIACGTAAYMTYLAVLGPGWPGIDSLISG